MLGVEEVVVEEKVVQHLEVVGDGGGMLVSRGWMGEVLRGLQRVLMRS